MQSDNSDPSNAARPSDRRVDAGHGGGGYRCSIAGIRDKPFRPCPRKAARCSAATTAQALDLGGFLDLIHPDDRAATDAAIHYSISALTRYDFDFRTASPAATVPWVRTRGRTRGGAGEPIDITGILIDAARRTSGDEENSRLAAIVTSSDAAIVGEALDGTVTDWNRGAEALFGYTAAEVIGKNAVHCCSRMASRTMPFNIMERIKAASASSGTRPSGAARTTLLSTCP